MTPTAEKTKYGKIVWRVNYTVANRRVRKSFRSRESARAWIEENSDIATTEGRIFWQAWRGITAAERHELTDSLVIVRELRETEPNATLVEAAKKYRDQRIAVKKSIPFEKAIQGFLNSKCNQSRKGKLSDGWLYVLETCLEKNFRELPDNHKTLVEYSTEELEIYLEDLEVSELQSWNLTNGS